MALLISKLLIIYNVIRLGKALFMQDCATGRDMAVVSRIMTAAMLKGQSKVMQTQSHTRGRLESSCGRRISYRYGTDNQWEELIWTPQAV